MSGKRRRPALAPIRGLATAAALVCASCAPREQIVIPRYTTTRPSPSGGLRAGAGKREITPLPGFPMGGHSLGGRLSRGRWLPLYARAFYFQDAAGGSLLMISCDLFAIPAGLQEKVAALVNARHPDVSVKNLILAATHTHQGPGNFLSSPFYNGFASPMPGFDRSLFDALAESIAGAADAAIRNAGAPGRVRIRLTRASVHALIDGRRIPGFVRNRAVAAFERNAPEDRCAVLFPGVPFDACPCRADPDPCPPSTTRKRAFGDPVDVIRVERTDASGDHAVGALVFFGIHPTAIADHAAVYSSDFIGLAMRSLEESQPDGFVAGFFNGADGDVSPDWGRQDADDVRRIGATFAAAADAATVPVAELDDAATIRVHRTAPKQRKFCEGYRPLMGVAAVGGAEDGRFVSFDLGWRSPRRLGRPYKKRSIFSRLGFWRLSAPSQRFKQPGLDYSTDDLVSLTAILAPAGDYPERVPLTVVRFGPVTLLAVPFEMTTVAAMHVRRALGSVVGEPVVLIGLANEYFSYVTSKAEFEEQDYEGASTLFGEDSERCIAELARNGARLLGPLVSETVAEDRFDAGPPPLFDMRFGPGFWGANPYDSDASLESVFAGGSPDAWPRFEWTSDDPGRASVYQTSGGRFVPVENDDGGRMLLELVDGRPDADPRALTRRWNEIWFPPASAAPAASIFVVRRTPASPPTCSTPFVPNDPARDPGSPPLGTGPCPPEIPRLPDRSE